MLRERNKISMVTLQGRMRYLNSFWTFLQKEKLVDDNPVARIESLRIESTIKKAYSAQEMEALRLACDRPRERALIEFLYATGVRVSELCSLDVGDIDLYKQEFRVMGKGRKERRLYISDTACFHLFRYLKWRSQREGLTMEELADRPLFTATKKPYNRLTKAGVQYLLKQLGKQAGVGNVHPHRFRRTFATDLLNRGMRIEEVMVLMGHTKIETTLIYCNIKQDNVRESYRKYAA
jgi:site-specific recombinase XerD